MNRRFGKNDILLLGMLAVVILVFYVGMTSALQSGDSIITVSYTHLCLRWYC